MKEIKTYQTDDGKIFYNRAEALKHQKELDGLDFKVEYFKLLQENEKLKRNLEFERKLRNPFQEVAINQDEYQQRIKDMPPKGVEIMFDTTEIK